MRGAYFSANCPVHRFRFPCSGGTSPWRKAAGFKGADLVAASELVLQAHTRITHWNLHHAAKVVWPGRTFFRRMVDLLSCFRKKGHPIWLNKEFHLDLQWWDHLLAQWHDVSFWLYPGLSPVVDLEVASDAAGSLGFGAYFKGFWFASLWAVSQQKQSTTYKELFPVVVAVHVWGPQVRKACLVSLRQ